MVPPGAPASTVIDAVAHEEASDYVVTGEAVALDLRPASFIVRSAGAIIDWLVYLGTFFALTLLFVTVAGQLGLDQAITTAITLVGLVISIVVIPITVETATRGKSLGKLAIGARIVRSDGGSIGVRHAMIRALVGVFEIYFTLGAIAAGAGLFDARSRRLGDLLAGTYSQNERVSRETPPVFGVPAPLLAWAVTADVARMPDPLARRVAQFLAQARDLVPVTRQRLALSLAGEVAPFVSPLPATEPELFLAAVAALRREREFSALTVQHAHLERLRPALAGLPRRFPDR